MFKMRSLGETASLVAVIVLIILIILYAILPKSSPGIEKLGPGKAIVHQGETLALGSGKNIWFIYREGDLVKVRLLFTSSTALCEVDCSVKVGLGLLSPTITVTNLSDNAMMVEWYDSWIGGLTMR